VKGGDDYEVVDEKDYKADQKKDPAQQKWGAGAERIIHEDGYFKLDAAKAKAYRVADYNDVKDLDTLYQLFPNDIAPASVKMFRDDWLDEIAEFFRGPLVKLVLIMLGIIGMIIEIKLPGTAIGGIVAGICFVLF